MGHGWMTPTILLLQMKQFYKKELDFFIKECYNNHVNHIQYNNEVRLYFR